MMFGKKSIDKKVNRLAVFFMMFVAALSLLPQKATELSNGMNFGSHS